MYPYGFTKFGHIKSRIVRLVSVGIKHVVRDCWSVKTLRTQPLPKCQMSPSLVPIHTAYGTASTDNTNTVQHLHPALHNPSTIQANKAATSS